MNVRFNITPTRTNCFTTAQAGKVQAGIEIFQQVINSEEFKTRVNNFQWRTSEGVAFNRFFLSNGMSNAQVCDTISNGTIWTTGTNETIVVNVVPCSTVQDVEVCCTSTTPCVCIDTNVLNNSWYTPVHVACAIMHEWCCCNGFNWSTPTARIESWNNNTVPVACAWICKDVCTTVCNNTEVTNWCNTINDTTFDYCACTTTYNVWTNTTNVVSPIVKIDECINIMECEVNWLNNANTVTPDVTNRITTLTNCITTMNEMKISLCNTSLDGCDVACVPVNTVSAVSSN